jgi:hypothetical protein
MTALVIRFDERDVAFTQQLAGDLPVMGLLVGLDLQEEVAPCSVSCRKTLSPCGAHPPG